MTEDQTLDWYSDEAATFGDRLAAARETAGMSQKDLSKHLGVKLSTLKNWENDLNEPRANKLQMVSGLLGVSLTWLLNGEGDGIDMPQDAESAPDVTAILTEMRALRTQMLQAGERLAQLEKRLRTAVRTSA